MDCPSCGLVNLPEASKCDCGYDFTAGNPADFPGWEINLAWGQKVAAFWSISWPAWIGSTGLIILLMRWHPVDLPQNYYPITSLGGNLAFFTIQALLIGRLVGKNYRSFRLYVVRKDESKSRKLSIQEVFWVWLWILGPQLAVLLAVSLVVGVWGTKLPSAAVSGFFSMSIWLQFLVIGPYAVSLALRAKYRAFRLEAHGLRTYKA